MNLQHLRYFLTLADIEHYTEAAKKLHITQPTLSHAMMMLEEELQVSLFVKAGRNIKLTEAGSEFYDTVKATLTTLDTGIDLLKHHQGQKTTIHLTLLRVLGRKAVPNLVRQFLDQFPEAQVQFDFHNDSGMSHDLITGVANDKYDIAFCSKLGNFPTISFLPIFAQDFVLIVPKGHPLTLKQEVTVADTLAYPQVWFSKRSGIRPILDGIFKEEKASPHIAFEVSEDETVAGLVDQGFGLAIIPRFDFLDTLEEIDIIEIESLKNARIYYAAYRNDKVLPHEVQVFLDFLRERSDLLKGIE